MVKEPVTPKRRQNIEKVSVALSRPNIEWAKAEAERLGLSVSEVVRRALDAAREKQERKDKIK